MISQQSREFLYRGTAPPGCYDASAFIASVQQIPLHRRKFTVYHAEANKVAPLLGYRLLEAGVNLQPDDPFQRLILASHRSAFATTRQLQVAEEALAILLDAHIPALVHKGAHLARSIYPDPGCRAMGDIDLLVRPDDFTAAYETLQQHGWTSEDTPAYRAKSLGPIGIIRGYHFRRSQGVRAWMLSKAIDDTHRVYIDLHRWLIDPGWLPVSDEMFWEGSVNHEPTLLKELLWTILHGVKSAATGHAPLSHAVDAWWLADAAHIDSGALLSEARLWGCERTVKDMAGFLDHPSAHTFPPRLYARNAFNDMLVEFLANKSVEYSSYLSYAHKIAPQILLSGKLPRVSVAGLKILLDRVVLR